MAFAHRVTNWIPLRTMNLNDLRHERVNSFLDFDDKVFSRSVSWNNGSLLAFWSRNF